MALGDSYPVELLDDRGNRVATEVAAVQFTDGADQPSRSGGGSQPGIWKTYGVDCDNQPIGGITLGDGALLGRWWTPAAVVPDPDTDPFLCALEILLVVGSTTAMTAPTLGLPHHVDGSANDLIAVTVSDQLPFATVLGKSGGGSGFVTGFCGVADGLPFQEDDGTNWDATHPGAWSEGDRISFLTTFQAMFLAD